MKDALKLALNVLGWRRFASPNKGFAKQRPGLAKCGGVKPHKGACAGWGFTEPEPPIGGEALTVCYVLVFCFISFILFISNTLIIIISIITAKSSINGNNIIDSNKFTTQMIIITYFIFLKLII
jgi:hypothetical protein